ncbi:hypothetical protein D3C83_53410 [compost metagenome]
MWRHHVQHVASHVLHLQLHRLAGGIDADRLGIAAKLEDARIEILPGRLEQAGLVFVTAVDRPLRHSGRRNYRIDTCALETVLEKKLQRFFEKFLVAPRRSANLSLGG